MYLLDEAAKVDGFSARDVKQLYTNYTQINLKLALKLAEFAAKNDETETKYALRNLEHHVSLQRVEEDARRAHAAQQEIEKQGWTCKTSPNWWDQMRSRVMYEGRYTCYGIKSHSKPEFDAGRQPTARDDGVNGVLRRHLPCLCNPLLTSANTWHEEDERKWRRGDYDSPVDIPAWHEHHITWSRRCVKEGTFVKVIWTGEGEGDRVQVYEGVVMGGKITGTLIDTSDPGTLVQQRQTPLKIIIKDEDDDFWGWKNWIIFPLHDASWHAAEKLRRQAFWLHRGPLLLMPMQPAAMTLVQPQPPPQPRPFWRLVEEKKADDEPQPRRPEVGSAAWEEEREQHKDERRAEREETRKRGWGLEGERSPLKRPCAPSASASPA
jgi:hypothetical protein